MKIYSVRVGKYLLAACAVLELDEEATKDLIEVAGRTRSDITKGCTVRYELASQKVESAGRMAGTDGLFGQLGGDKGVRAFIDDLYELIQEDSRVKLFFSGSKVDSIKAVQGEYIAQLFGSPVEYVGRPLPRIHATLQVHDYHFDAFLELCRKALLKRGLDAETTDECVVLLETERSNVVNLESRKHDVRATQEASRRKSLFDRLGGEQTIAEFVNKAYDRALEEPSLRSFLEKGKAKIRRGPNNYEVKELRPAHYGLNIADRHFDRMLSVMLRVLVTEMGVDRRLARELIKTLQTVRTDITLGCTVRMEVGRQRINSGKQHLYIGLGEADGIKKLFEAVMDLSLVDPRIKTFFRIPHIQMVRENIGKYLVGLLGGPQTYEGKGLFEVHEHLGLPSALVDEVDVSIESIRESILGMRQDENHHSHHSKDDKSLVDRLGGDLSLEALVENMYDRAKADSRVRYFLEKGPAKQKHIRMKMYQYLSGAFGGAVQYDRELLKPAHYFMNITNYHFDALCDSLMEAAKEIGVDSETLDDVFLVVNRTRSDITTGCMVRMELARGQRGQGEGLIEKLGGQEGIECFIVRLYECIERDRRINPYFEGSKLSSIKKAQSAYITMVLGGPVVYKGRDLETLHSVLAITDYHFDCFMQQVDRSLRDIGMVGDVVDEAVVRLEKIRRKVLHGHYEKTGYRQTSADHE
ncbi:hypothetical protein Pmar_PMAR024501 [Perkinsus marinus ATCC 50983]|uniref:Uncharacterized protein n=1 Tax=Perkinsus marinus (strain ATCC 50983 / TXsc) TaxID=423536 RepID=C5LT57_PERM5|nr:hypothetical protein Pmar_PMAR024501 [Perkinsus marinus ATCC 50983]EER00025.1 hypothetical protein Pmar_PMAR024501 [Perkinsus marinus ATCC 50983]|eukprot:XP_002767307.1 hypothetical protein Pmar_PMAR024501 [Perkinsus marinus ATCC 50983]